MLRPRFRKLWRDVVAERGRLAMMLVAIAVSLIAVGAVLGAGAILTREIAVNYRGTRPASATLELPGGVPRSLLVELRRDARFSEVEAREVVLARARVANAWRPLLLFVIDDFSDLRLNTFRSESGAWPPPDGSLLLERTATGMLEATTDQLLWLKTPNGLAMALRVSGTVHDPGLAPAWQEREGYGYITRATLARLGEAPILHELRILVSSKPLDGHAIEATARALSRELVERGHPVHEIRIPPPGQHPHQRQMLTILWLLLTFSALSLVLSAILVATSLAALLARQVREIGIMKTIGARTSQLAGMYFVFIALLALVAGVAALPLGMLSARAFSGAVAEMLNFTLTSVALPGWVFAVQAVAGVGIPLLVAAIPVLRATRITAREAIDQHGLNGESVEPRYSALPMAARNALRRPLRLARTLTLLAAGGAMFMTALNVSAGWQRNIDKVYQTRHYDIEVRLQRPEPEALSARLGALPDVRAVESWGYSPAALSEPNQIDVVRTYPDRGHGSLMVLAPPPNTTLIHFPLRAGRWLEDGDSDAVVLNHSAAAQANGIVIGRHLWLSLDGHRSRFRVVGIVEEIGAAGVAYLSKAAFSQITNSVGRARVLRIATSQGDKHTRELAIQAIERTLAEAGVSVDLAVPLTELRTAMSDHVVILVRALMAMALVMGAVGALGLGTTMGVSVVERTREFGVMRALGATPRRLSRLIFCEALAIAASSSVLAVAAAVPLTLLVDRIVGNLGFLAPLPFVLALPPVLVWALLSGLVALMATWLPAVRVAELSVCDALNQP